MWDLIAKNIGVTGLTKVLLEGCVYGGRSGNLIALVLDERQKPLLNDKHVTRIKEAVCNFLDEDIEIMITTAKIKKEVKKMLFEFNGVFSIGEDGTNENVSWRFGPVEPKA